MVDTKHTKIQVTRTGDGSIRGEAIDRGTGCTLRVFYVPVNLSQEETVARVLDGLGFENSGQIPPVPAPMPGEATDSIAKTLLYELFKLVKYHEHANTTVLLTRSYENRIREELQLSLTKEPQSWQSF